MRWRQSEKRRGLATIVTSAIMMSAVCILGSTGVVWSQSTLTSQQIEMTDTVNDYSNKLNESINFEYVYCSENPCQTIMVIVTNTGKIGLELNEISISDKNSSFNKIYAVSKGKIMPDGSIAIPINDPSFSSYNVLDVKGTTVRGNTIRTQIST